MKSLVNIMIVLALTGIAGASVVADFDDLTLTADTHWNGSDETGGFISGSASFNNSFTDWGGGAISWGGFAYSNTTDTTNPGYTNQYSTYAGLAQSGSNFGVGFQDAYNGFNPVAVLESPTLVSGLYVTNTTYTALDLVNGSAFSKQFGGVTGADEDWFLLTITGKDQAGNSLGTVDFYLADYRSADNSQDYILDSWSHVDLSPLGVVSGLEFSLTSSDTGDYGMNTPAYFAVDTIVPEPATVLLLGLGGLLLHRKKT